VDPADASRAPDDGSDSYVSAHDEVVLQTGWLDLGALNRERDARVTLEVPDLLACTEVREQGLVAIDAYPNDEICGEPSGLIVTRCASRPDRRSRRTS
jgi:hypothetical protein